MLPAGKELISGVKLGAVAHVLVHVEDLCQDAAKEGRKGFSLREYK